jgi:hypothetical protein
MSIVCWFLGKLSPFPEIFDQYLLKGLPEAINLPLNHFSFPYVP